MTADPAQDVLRDRKAEHIRLALDPATQLGGERLRPARARARRAARDRPRGGRPVDHLPRPAAARAAADLVHDGRHRARRGASTATSRRRPRRSAWRWASARSARRSRTLSQVPTFQVRDVAPSIPLLANLGAVQLNYGYGVDGLPGRRRHDRGRRAGAPPQRSPGGDPARGAGELRRPAAEDRRGGRASRRAGRRQGDRLRPLWRRRPAAGAGRRRASSTRRASAAPAGRASRRAAPATWPIGELFAGWGIPTPESIRQLREIPEVTVIGSGGVRNGLDAAKAIGTRGRSRRHGAAVPGAGDGVRRGGGRQAAPHRRGAARSPCSVSAPPI